MYEPSRGLATDENVSCSPSEQPSRRKYRAGQQQQRCQSPPQTTVYDYTEAHHSSENIDNRLMFNYDEDFQPWLGKIRNQMQQDVKALLEAVDPWKRNATTLVCAILVKQDNWDYHAAGGPLSVRKFVFSNQFEYLPECFPNTDHQLLIAKVHELNYHLVQTQQSHSEMALLQFLHVYKHEYKQMPIAMASSKSICFTCDSLLKLLWGGSWHEEVCPDAARDTDSRRLYNRWYTPAVLLDLIGENYDILKTFIRKHRPQYAKYWYKYAPEYVGCTARDRWPLWRCKYREYCFRHGLDTAVNQQLPDDEQEVEENEDDKEYEDSDESMEEECLDNTG